MKKILYISLLVFTVSLFGCSVNNESTANESTETFAQSTFAEISEETMTEPTTEKLIETTTSEEFTIGTQPEPNYETTPDGRRYTITPDGRKAIVRFTNLRSYITEDTFTIEVSGGRGEEEYVHSVEFNADRECIDSDGLVPVEITDISNMKGLYVGDLKTLYGDFATDTGAGAYIPGYVTTDAYYVFFHLGENTGNSKNTYDYYKLAWVMKLDLLAGEIVEEYYLGD